MFIYGLVCPIADSVRYVGQSINPLSRFVSHIQEPCNPLLRRWINRLLKRGKLPRLITLEVTTLRDANSTELRWIHYFDSWHGGLLNINGVLTHSLSGRPPIQSAPMADRLPPVYCSTAQKRKWEKAARKSNLSLSAWVRAALDDAAGH